MPDAPPIRAFVADLRTGLVDRPWAHWFTDVYAVVKYLHVYDGNPNGNITADVGHIALNLSGGANTVLWVKESYTNNQGWVNK